jgi:hypothetical protein
MSRAGSLRSISPSARLAPEQKPPPTDPIMIARASLPARQSASRNSVPIVSVIALSVSGWFILMTATSSTIS